MGRWSDIVDDHPRLATAVSKIRAWLPPLNFITIHYGYFIIVCLLASLVFWGSSDPAFSISYTDSIFVCVSAMTEAGLNTTNLSEMTTWQQTMLFLLIILGSSIWVSIWTVLVRKRAFEKRFDAIVAAERARRLKRAGSTMTLVRRFSMSLRKTHTLPADGSAPPATGSGLVDGPRSQTPPATPSAPSQNGDASNSVPPFGHVAFVDTLPPNASGQSTSSAYLPSTRPTRRRPDPEKRDQAAAPNFLTRKTVGRNGQFYDLSSEEREHLGGCEYRALKVLSVIVPLYFFLWQFLGCIAIGAWMKINQPEPALGNGIDPWWLGVFNGASAFNNSGMSLLDLNMIPFQNAYFVLITMGLLILAGNTAYPVFLRFIIWSGLTLLNMTTAENELSDMKATFKFILKYPRRVYTNLFPSRATWWLLFMVILLNCTDWVCFELLNLGNPITEDIPPGSRVLDGLFQALAVRSGGFYVVPIAQLYIGLQVLYVIMMYVSVYPVVITMRHSNVYEERSLGIYDDDQTASSDPENATQLGTGPRLSATDPYRLTMSSTIGSALHRQFVPWHGVGVTGPPRGDTAESRISFISHQIQGQLAHDVWWLVLAVLAITTIETSHFLADPVSYSVFNVMFEVVSAYGCVGISVGVPFNAFSFSGGWHAASKLVLCLVMLRGRHRGLPVALDRAVRLPGEQLHREEEEDHRIRRSMTSRRMTVDA